MSKLVLVSGAAGGVGSATARRFAADGAKVALTDIDADRLKVVADEVGGLALPADGTRRDEVAAVVRRAVAELGGLDTVIAAQGAAVSGTASPKADDAWFRAFDVNLHGSFYLASEALPHLVPRRGSLVLFASTAGLLSGPPGTAGYSAAKAGVIGLVRWLARDFGPRGVRVNGVCPGWVRTPLGDGAMRYLAEREGIAVEEAYRRVAEHVPLRRVAEPAEIAAVCAFLASADASIVTGHVLVADGGGAAVDPATTLFDQG
ncbi:SDR family NAD(P)-dependent oxidoreductase [Amycolatopsis australiensis]|uniref:NAD(P)-dependent dehydrogenase, short-chain alcohol dehydrogenase family n=1 Tax=Amycolatopsis australiensis TaxID=546364 RepID=A0A1K1S637_9PSEU|nr:SDR family oxidoreductase [Amycolatopsis australiensis]SFW79896.1 NAD(P)-dependent dehydrogenase, short-chain alcohol dehydrogenase family [Amycolatopsis australiensis]